MAAAQATPLEDWRAPPGDVPYLVIQGLNDEVAPAENGYSLKAELGDRVTGVDIPNAGHLQPLQAPKEVSSRSGLDQGSAERRETQCFEMVSNRSIYDRVQQQGDDAVIKLRSKPG
jgi:hypothetical protein